VQGELAERWFQLIRTIEERDKKLESAGEIHRFNRDIGRYKVGLLSSVP
jgi:hypothetical protein